MLGAMSTDCWLMAYCGAAAPTASAPATAPSQLYWLKLRSSIVPTSVTRPIFRSAPSWASASAPPASTPVAAMVSARDAVVNLRMRSSSASGARTLALLPNGSDPSSTTPWDGHVGIVAGSRPGRKTRPTDRTAWTDGIPADGPLNASAPEPDAPRAPSGGLGPEPHAGPRAARWAPSRTFWSSVRLGPAGQGCSALLARSPYSSRLPCILMHRCCINRQALCRSVHSASAVRRRRWRALVT